MFNSGASSLKPRARRYAGTLSLLLFDTVLRQRGAVSQIVSPLSCCCRLALIFLPPHASLPHFFVLQVYKCFLTNEEFISDAKDFIPVLVDDKPTGLIKIPIVKQVRSSDDEIVASITGCGCRWDIFSQRLAGDTVLPPIMPP